MHRTNEARVVCLKIFESEYNRHGYEYFELTLEKDCHAMRDMACSTQTFYSIIGASKIRNQVVIVIESLGGFIFAI